MKGMPSRTIFQRTTHKMFCWIGYPTGKNQADRTGFSREKVIQSYFSFCISLIWHCLLFIIKYTEKVWGGAGNVESARTLKTVFLGENHHNTDVYSVPCTMSDFWDPECLHCLLTVQKFIKRTKNTMTPISSFLPFFFSLKLKKFCFLRTGKDRAPFCWFHFPGTDLRSLVHQHYS